MTILKRMLNSKKISREGKLLALISLARIGSQESLELLAAYRHTLKI